MRRKIIALCVIALLVLSCAMTVSAQNFDPERTGTISVTLTEQYEKEPIVGAELCVYYVATVHKNENGNLSYAYTAAFENVEIDLDDPALAKKMELFVLENDVPSVRVTTDENGTARCNDLALGLYFIRQTGNVEGFAPCTPFLVTVPGMGADGYVYEVNASPKTEVAKLTSITIQKVWNTNGAAEAADHVTVQLLKDDNVVITAILNAQNNWQVTYSDMPESDAYSILEVDIPKGFTATYKQNGYTFTVTNTATLVQTGQLIWPIPVLAVIGMLFVAAGILLLRKKRTANA